jgi:hypothetical protein
MGKQNQGLSPNRGGAPKWFGKRYGKAQPCLTSGGGAVTQRAHDSIPNALLTGLAKYIIPAQRLAHLKIFSATGLKPTV